MADDRAPRAGPVPGPGTGAESRAGVAGVVVRPARRDELGAVLGLWREAEAVPSVSDDPASLGRLLDTSDDALLVAEMDGGLVGTVIAGWDGWRGNLYRLAVVPGSRRRGIALQLVTEAERRLGAKGAVRVSALVLTDHDPAVALWRAAGYRYYQGIGRFVRSLP